MPANVSEGYVKVSTKADMSGSVTFNATKALNHKGTANIFKSEATSLVKNTKYYYQAVCGKVQSSIYSFTTGSLSDDFTFVRASDSQSKTEDGYDIFQKAITKVNDTYKPSFILETGDLVDTNYFEDEWRWFIGKSESSSYQAWAFREHFSVPNECKADGVTPGTVYSFDYGKAHFVILNSECKGDGLKAQAQWAAQDMAKTKQKYIIAAIHRGPYGGSGIASDISEAFTPVFDQYNVELVLFGHDHSYIRTKALKNGTENKNGTVYLECGGCASKQDPANEKIPGYAEITGTPGMPVYDVITVTDESIKVKTVTVNEEKDTISSLQDTGKMNPLTPGAKVDFEVFPQVHNKVSEEPKTPTQPVTHPATQPDTKTPANPVTKVGKKVSKPRKGKIYVIGNSKYKVTNINKNKYTVSYLGISKKKTAKVTIPNTIKIGSVICKVDTIASNALKNNKKVTNIVIGTNIKTIQKRAFYGCKNLKKIRIKSKLLKKIGTQAFSGTNKKITIKVPVKKLNTYKKILKNKGTVSISH